MESNKGIDLAEIMEHKEGNGIQPPFLAIMAEPPSFKKRLKLTLGAFLLLSNGMI
jgi:hypothetical protein